MSAHPTPELHDETAAELSDGPGRRLRVARQARGLELGAIADELHLGRAMLESLEHDDYESLPGEVFVVGYIRKYARLVGLDPEPLLAAYRTKVPRHEPAWARAAALPAPQPGSGHLLVRLVGVGVLLLLGALAVLWWQARQPAAVVESADLGLEEQARSVPMADPVPPSAPQAPAGTGTASQPPGPAQASPLPPQPRTGTPPLEPAETPPAIEVEAGASPPVSAEAIAGDAPGAEPETRTESTGSPARAQEDEIEEAAAETGPEIVLSFDGPCWVDVRDSERKYKLFGEMKKGDRHVLEGEPPYSVILGNAAAAQITIDGTPFDLSAISRGNVARFTLDPDETP